MLLSKDIERVNADNALTHLNQMISTQRVIFDTKGLTTVDSMDSIDEELRSLSRVD